MSGLYSSQGDRKKASKLLIEAGEVFAEAAMFMEAYPATAEAVTMPTTVS